MLIIVSRRGIRCDLAGTLAHFKQLTRDLIDH